jgi:hypothetical protein
METKFKIIETEKYTLAVSDEEIKEGEYGLADIIASDFYGVAIYNGAFAKHYFKKIIAYQPKGNVLELDLPLLLEEECCEGDGSNCNGSCCIVEDEALKFANEIKQDVSQYDNGRWYGRIEGYNTATKRYSEEDLRKAINMARGIKEGKETFTAEDISGSTEVCTYGWKFEFDEDEIIQFLKQPKWFVAELEYYYHSSKELYSDAGFVKCTKEQYESIKSEIPTCPLKIELKTTIINNKIYLEGTYLN